MIAVIPQSFSEDMPEVGITINMLKNKPLIIYRRFEQLIYETCMEAGFEPEIKCKNDDARTTMLWANKGLGIGIIPKAAFTLVDNSNLTYREINNEKLKTRIAEIWRKDRYIAAIAKKFLEYFGE